MPSPLLRLVAVAAWSALLAGCAAPGEPSPRRPPVPEAVKDLSAHQQGDGVVLDFTLPRTSTEDAPLAAPPTIEIYRGAPPVAGAPPAPSALRLVDTVPGDTVSRYETGGRVTFTDPLARADLEANPGSLLGYIVRTRISAKRASADSNAVVVRVYPAPGAIHDLTTTLTEHAIALVWTPPAAAPGATSLTYRVYRREGQSSAAQSGQNLAVLAETDMAAYSDAAFTFGPTYVYDVRAVAHFGADAVESGPASPLATVQAKDVFPPAPPEDVDAVVNPATPEAPASVELTWGISSEADLAGYVVFRSEQPDTQGERLTVGTLPSPALRDTSVLPGHMYYYRVEAVDNAGNESTLSPAVSVEVPESRP
jgi:hypothetical protein